MIGFASDNYAGLAPEALSSLATANAGFAPAYGEDEYTVRAADALRAFFDHDCDVFFVFNGTAANSLALASLCHSYQSVICADVAHIETDECGAPEFFSNGSKLLLARTQLGKVQPGSVAELVEKREDIHYPRPKVLSLTQPTELATVYSIKELDQLKRVARRHSLAVHMDGARLFNALVNLDLSPAEATWKRGVDVLCLGATILGLALGEAVVFFNRNYSADFAYRCKQAGQLASKMRTISAPWESLLSKDAWRKHARHANEMAQKLSKGLSRQGIEIAYPTEANGVFTHVPNRFAERLDQAQVKYYNFIGGTARFMCSWATRPRDVDHLIALSKPK